MIDVPLTVTSVMKATAARDKSWLKESRVILFGGADQRKPETRAGSNSRNGCLFRLCLAAGYLWDIPSKKPRNPAQPLG
jgi:hypothetical protein